MTKKFDELREQMSPESRDRAHAKYKRMSKCKIPPSPDEIRQAREDAGLSQTKAGELVHVACRTWQQWEAQPEIKSHQKMHPAFWELFNLKTKKLKKIKGASPSALIGSKASR